MGRNAKGHSFPLVSCICLSCLTAPPAPATALEAPRGFHPRGQVRVQHCPQVRWTAH